MRLFFLLTAFLFFNETAFTQLTAESIISDNIIVQKLTTKFSLSSYDHADIVLRFNKDTIIICGYLSKEVHNSPKNIIYRTLDGGERWEQLEFKGNAWIYDAHCHPDGKVWMGGSDEFIHYSNDYGKTWDKKPKPFNPHDRVLSVYMADSLYGIAGRLSNGLAVTYNNWKTSTQIETPLDQGKFKILQNSSRDRVEKVEILDSVIIVNQNDHIYFSKIVKPKWQEFNIPVKDFSVDADKRIWNLYSLNNIVYQLSSGLELVKELNPQVSHFQNQDTAIEDKILHEFFAPGIASVEIKGVEYNFQKMSGGCMPFPLYKEAVHTASYLPSDSLFRFTSDSFDIKEDQNYNFSEQELIESVIQNKTLKESIQFTEEDFKDYERVIAEVRKESKEEAEWGGDFSYYLNLDHSYFDNFRLTTDSLEEKFLNGVFKPEYVKSFSSRRLPFLVLIVVNTNADTLKISSFSSICFGLPWLVACNGTSGKSYNPKITTFVRSVIPTGFNAYGQLLGGELIYKLIRERIISEQKYKNGFR